MDDDRYEIEVLPAAAGTGGDGHELVVHADLERLRREIAAPAIVREAGPGAEYAYADFFKAKISNPNTRKAVTVRPNHPWRALGSMAGGEVLSSDGLRSVNHVFKADRRRGIIGGASSFSEDARRGACNRPELVSDGDEPGTRAGVSSSRSRRP